MKKKVSLILFFFVMSLQCFTIENPKAGARSVALSHASISISDIWGTFHNQAGLTSIKTISTGIFYESRFQLKDLSLMAITTVLPTKTGVFGISFSQIGTGTFKENKAGLAFAKKLSPKISAGIQFNYFSSILPENKATKSFFTFEGGLILHPTSTIHLGAHVFNPLEQGITTLSGKIKTPAIYRIGGNYHISNIFLISAECETNTINPLVIRVGSEFSVIEKLVFRIGVTENPFNYSAGVGYKTGNLTTDFGFSYFRNLGLSPSVSIYYTIK